MSRRWDVGAVVLALLALLVAAWLVNAVHPASRGGAEGVELRPRLLEVPAAALRSTNPSASRRGIGQPSEPQNPSDGTTEVAGIEAGVATWFNSYGHGLYAAVPSYSWGDPHYQATVCRQDDQSQCVEVTVLDCLCGGSDTLIDLSLDAFARLEDPLRGVLPVTVESSDGPELTQPATDVQP